MFFESFVSNMHTMDDLPAITRLSITSNTRCLSEIKEQSQANAIIHGYGPSSPRAINRGYWNPIKRSLMYAPALSLRPRSGAHRGVPYLPGLPESHRRRIRTTNGLERLNHEIKRGTRVMRIFPNREACVRLVTVLATEQVPRSHRCLRGAQRRVVGSTRFSFVPSLGNISYYGFGLVGHSTGSHVTGEAVTPQSSNLG